MFRNIAYVCLLILSLSIIPTSRAEDQFPKPSLYPKTWELDFQHGKPTRVVVQGGKDVPKAYWYMIYTVTNNSNSEQLFLPSFELVTEDGAIHKSDFRIPKAVFDAIKKREGARFLEPAALIGGELRIGPEQAKDGVAIWPGPTPDMGGFGNSGRGL